jgi:hypothetical protein
VVAGPGRKGEADGAARHSGNFPKDVHRSCPILAPWAVTLVAPRTRVDPTSPLFIVEQQRPALVSRLAKQWSDAPWRSCRRNAS